MGNSSIEGREVEALRRAADGDSSAARRVWDVHRPRLKAMVDVRLDRRVRTRVDPSDIVQESLLEAHRRLADYLRTRPLPFYPWLRQIAWERVAKAHRRHLKAGKRAVGLERDAAVELSDASVVLLAERFCPTDGGSGPAARAMRAESQARIRDGLRRLPAADRELLVLRYLEGLSPAETAAILNIGPSAEKMRHLRAVRRMKKLLE